MPGFSFVCYGGNILCPTLSCAVDEAGFALVPPHPGESFLDLCPQLDCDQDTLSPLPFVPFSLS